MTKISHHPLWGGKEEYYVPKNMEKLVIGTCPPYRLCMGEKDDTDLDFFYGSHDNSFWSVLSFLNQEKNSQEFDNKLYRPRSEEECKDLLEKYHIGLVDVVKSCIHNDGRSTDKDLLHIEFLEELISILKRYPNITIYCTSEYVLTLLGSHYAEHIVYDKKKREGMIKFYGIESSYSFFLLYAPTNWVINRYKKNMDSYFQNYKRMLGK